MIEKRIFNLPPLQIQNILIPSKKSEFSTVPLGWCTDNYYPSELVSYASYLDKEDKSSVLDNIPISQHARP